MGIRERYDSSSKAGCKKSNTEIEAGCKLPSTVADLRVAAAAKEVKTGTAWLRQSSLAGFSKKVNRIDNNVLNRILGMWVHQTAQAWVCVEDQQLQASFGYNHPNLNVHLPEQAEMAMFGHEAGLDMKISFDKSIGFFLLFPSTSTTTLTDSSIQLKYLENQKLLSSLGLIHKVWTTHRNYFGSMGASVTFFNSEWRYVTHHFDLKLIAWHHRGKWLAKPMVNLSTKHGLLIKIIITHPLFFHTCFLQSWLLFFPHVSSNSQPREKWQ